MATNVKRTATDIIQDAEHVLTKASAPAVRKALVDADKHRAKKLFPKGFFETYRANVAAARKAMGKGAQSKVKQKNSTGAEVAARKRLFDSLTIVRANVKTAFPEPEHKALREAFGVGTDINAKSTPGLLAAAGAVVEALGDEEMGRKARDAGVAATTERKLSEQRDALAAADALQSESIGTRKAGTGVTKSLLSQLEKAKARVREVVKLVFKSQPNVIASFAPTVARKAKKPRAQASSAKASTG